MNLKRKREEDCQSVNIASNLAIDECDVTGGPRTELCMTLVPPKRSRGDCKPTQLFGEVPGSSPKPRCFDAPPDTQSKTQIRPIRLYNPFEWYTGHGSSFVQLQSLTNSTQVQAHDPTTAYAQGLYERVKVHTLPVGQGDCTVIQCHPATGHAILFDCGTTGGYYLPISYFQSFFQLEEVISITVMISHAHRDHYNLIPKLFDLQTDPGKKLINKIKEVIVGGPEVDYQGTTIKSWLQKMKKVTYISDIKKIETYYFCSEVFKDVEFNVVAGTAANKKLKNQRGMVMRLSCKSCGAQLLFAGDMEGNVAKEMAEYSKAKGDFLSATHYKMSHHGAGTDANKEKWLEAIRPVEVHVSHQYIGRHSHPRCEAIDKVMKLNTVGTNHPIGGTGHDFYCCIDKDCKSGNIEEMKIQHRIFSTAPTKDLLCVISLTFIKEGGAKTEVHYGKAEEFKGATSNELPHPALDPNEDEED